MAPVARKRFPCPCCGELTIEEPASYDICSRCGWEDDGIESPWSISGPNHESLWAAQLRVRRPKLTRRERAAAFEELRAAEAARRLPGHLKALGRALGMAIPADSMVGHEHAYRL